MQSGPIQLPSGEEFRSKEEMLLALQILQQQSSQDLQGDYTSRADEYLRSQLIQGIQSTQPSVGTWKQPNLDGRNPNDTFDCMNSVLSNASSHQLLLSKLEQDRELIKLQMKQNEALMGARIAQMKEVAD